MLNRTQSSGKIYGVVFILIIGFTGTLVALAEQDAKVSDIQIAPRRQNETEAAYQRRLNMAKHANSARLRALPQVSKMQMLEKQSGETNATYQSRLQLIIKGLLKQQYSNPIPPKRGNETEAAYQARAGVVLRAMEALRNSLVARPGEEETAYFARLTARKERKLSSVPKRPGESRAAYRARIIQANRAKRTSPPK